MFHHPDVNFTLTLIEGVGSHKAPFLSAHLLLLPDGREKKKLGCHVAFYSKIRSTSPEGQIPMPENDFSHLKISSSTLLDLYFTIPRDFLRLSEEDLNVYSCLT